MKHPAWIVAAAIVPWTICCAAAQTSPDDWPCVQLKVPTIAASTVWSGPDPEQAGPWGQDFETAALAQRLASRRTPLNELDALIHAFAEKAGAEKSMRLTRVFAGVLELINIERSRIVGGIERYGRGQSRLAERIREEADQISAAKDEPGAPTSKDIAEVELRFTWDKRIFEERSQALQYVCETPVLLEQRLLEVARRIQAEL